MNAPTDHARLLPRLEGLWEALGGLIDSNDSSAQVKMQWRNTLVL